MLQTYQNKQVRHESNEISRYLNAKQLDLV
jgi:hypothetical protein